MLGDMKLREKNSVFTRCLKISSEGAERVVDAIPHATKMQWNAKWNDQQPKR